MHCGKKIIGILSSKTLREPKTVVFPQLEAIHKLSNGFRLLWLFPVDSSGKRRKTKIYLLPDMICVCCAIFSINVRSQIMTHHQFMAQFCDCPIKCVYDYFFQFYLLPFDAFLGRFFMSQFQ